MMAMGKVQAQLIVDGPKRHGCQGEKSTITGIFGLRRPGAMVQTRTITTAAPIQPDFRR